MTLGTHAAVGAAIATAFPAHPAAAFAAGFVSHFVLDSIPHWDYSLRSMRNKGDSPLQNDMEVWTKDFAVDILKMGADLLLGTALGLYVFVIVGGSPLVLILAGAAGAVTPDAFHFIYFKIRREPLTTLQRFHIFIQDSIKVKNAALGVILQVAVVIAVFSFARAF